MAPPYKNAYAYFRWDAYEFITQHRAWTVPQRNQTISTIWAGDPNVRNHYATHARSGQRWLRTSPGLPNPNPIPADPFTAADVNHAKSTHTMPVPVAALGLAPVTPIPPVAAAAAPVHAAVPAVAPAYVSSQLHDFWPRLPWSSEPNLPPFDLEAIRADEAGLTQDEWLDTKPHMPPPGDDSHWHGVKLLGTGGYGAAGLWVEADAANNICDRMVIKEAKTLSQSKWRDPRNWRDRLPREIRIHELLEERRAVDPDMRRHIVRFRAHRLLMRSRRYRLYLDYHAGGDLNAAMGFHVLNWSKEKNHVNEEKFIPEGFVWYTIRALATACLVLQNGTTSDIPINDWRSITHLDLRLPNVLLDVYTPPTRDDQEISEAESSNNARDAARAKEPVMPILADFGVSFFSPKSDGCPISDNPDDYVTAVDTRYPPQMHQQTEPYTIRLGEKTDVWGIGNIAWTLIANKSDDIGPYRCQKTRSTTYKEWKGRIPLAKECDLNLSPHDDSDVLMKDSETNPAANQYTRLIKELVRRCLNYSQDDRPTLREIIAEADEFLSDPDNTTFLQAIEDKQGLRLDLPEVSYLDIGQPVDEAREMGRTLIVPETLSFLQASSSPDQYSQSS